MNPVGESERKVPNSSQHRVIDIDITNKHFPTESFQFFAPIFLFRPVFGRPVFQLLPGLGHLPPGVDQPDKMSKVPSNSKIVVKSTTKISLHERFTELRKIAPPQPQPQQTVKRIAPPPPLPPPPSAPRPRYDLPYSIRHRSPSPDYGYEDYEHERYIPVGRNRTLAEQIADGMYLQPRRRPTFEAALQIKHRSIQNRLGLGSSYGGYRDNWNYGRFRERGGYRSWRGPRYRFSRGGPRGGGPQGFRRSRSFQVIIASASLQTHSIPTTRGVHFLV